MASKTHNIACEIGSPRDVSAALEKAFGGIPNQLGGQGVCRVLQVEIKSPLALTEQAASLLHTHLRTFLEQNRGLKSRFAALENIVVVWRGDVSLNKEGEDRLKNQYNELPFIPGIELELRYGEKGRGKAIWSHMEDAGGRLGKVCDIFWHLVVPDMKKLKALMPNMTGLKGMASQMFNPDTHWICVLMAAAIAFCLWWFTGLSLMIVLGIFAGIAMQGNKIVRLLIKLGKLLIQTPTLALVGFVIWKFYGWWQIWPGKWIAPSLVARIFIIGGVIVGALGLLIFLFMMLPSMGIPLYCIPSAFVMLGTAVGAMSYAPWVLVATFLWYGVYSFIRDLTQLRSFESLTTNWAFTALLAVGLFSLFAMTGWPLFASFSVGLAVFFYTFVSIGITALVHWAARAYGAYLDRRHHALFADDESVEPATGSKAAARGMLRLRLQFLFAPLIPSFWKQEPDTAVSAFETDYRDKYVAAAQLQEPADPAAAEANAPAEEAVEADVQQKTIWQQLFQHPGQWFQENVVSSITASA